MHCEWRGKPQNYPFPWDFVTLPEKDRATATGNIHKKFGKDRACGCGDMLADRQTNTQTDVLITILRHRFRRRSNKQLDGITIQLFLYFRNTSLTTDRS